MGWQEDGTGYGKCVLLELAIFGNRVSWNRRCSVLLYLRFLSLSFSVDRLLESTRRVLVDPLPTARWAAHVQVARPEETDGRAPCDLLNILWSASNHDLVSEVTWSLSRFQT